MQIIVVANETGKEELLKKKFPPGVEVIFCNSIYDIKNYTGADAFFILIELNKDDFQVPASKPVFINSTINTLKDWGLPKNVSRFNGWRTFLQSDLWEVATYNEAGVKMIFGNLNWKYTIVADEPGFVAARVIAMIINEAYFTLGDNVSTKKEIDIAMRLGTNYPYGPFEWSEQIGLQKIFDLLKKLSGKSSRYTVAPAMVTELQY